MDVTPLETHRSERSSHLGGGTGAQRSGKAPVRLGGWLGAPGAGGPGRAVTGVPRSAPHPEARGWAGAVGALPLFQNLLASSRGQRGGSPKEVTRQEAQWRLGGDLAKCSRGCTGGLGRGAGRAGKGGWGSVTRSELRPQLQLLCTPTPSPARRKGGSLPGSGWREERRQLLGAGGQEQVRRPGPVCRWAGEGWAAHPAPLLRCLCGHKDPDKEARRGQGLH